jgi:hypothetical protein
MNYELETIGLKLMYFVYEKNMNLKGLGTECGGLNNAAYS